MQKNKVKLGIIVSLLVIFLGIWSLAKIVLQKNNQTDKNTLEKNIPIKEQLGEPLITDSLIAEVRNEANPVGYFSDFYNRATVFPSFKNYLESEEKIGKLVSNKTSSAELREQLDSIGQGKIVSFMAPVRIYSQIGTEDVFIPVISLKKEGKEMAIENIGEYWNILQDNAEGLRLKDNSQATSSIEKLLEKTGSQTDNKSHYALIDSNGNDIFSSSQSVAMLNQILDDTSATLKDQIIAEENSGNRVKEKLFNDELSQLLSSPAVEKQTSLEKVTDILASVTNNTGLIFLKTEDGSEDYSTLENRCAKSGGRWFFEQCLCSEGMTLNIDKYCSTEEKLASNCQKNGGNWEETKNGVNPSKICGGKPILENPISKTNLKDSVTTKYCNCPENYCMGADGTCNKNEEDFDKDGITNKDDHCPEIDGSELSTINQDPASDYYGCSCKQIGTVMKSCPSSKCLGSLWVTYQEGEQECKNGQLLPYACNFQEEGLSKFCIGNISTGQPGESLAQNNLTENTQAGTKNNTFPISSIEENNGSSPSAYSVSESEPGEISAASSNAPGSAKSSGSGASAKATGGKPHTGKTEGEKKNSYLPRSPVDWSGLLPTALSNSYNKNLSEGTSTGGGKAEGIKAALRRIYNVDYQTYKMIFTYLSSIGHMDGGGVCEGCGKAKVDYKAPYKILDQIIVHEAMHCGQGCVVGLPGGLTPPECERVAVEKQIGSAHFEKTISTTKGNINDLMEEFPSQRQSVIWNGFEARGYLARYWCATNPQALDCNKSGDDFDLGDKTIYLDELIKKMAWAYFPFPQVQAYAPKASKAGKYYSEEGVLPGDAKWGIDYATKEKHQGWPPDNTCGPYPYGFGKEALLGAKQKEEDVIRKVMAASNQDIYPCLSSPPPDLPPVYGCEGAPTIQLAGD